MSLQNRTSLAIVIAVASLLPACTSNPRPGEPLTRRGDEIMVCGQLYHTGTPVVLFVDPGGYDAYRTEPRFRERTPDEPDKARYHTLRRNLAPELLARVQQGGWTVADLARQVDQFVVHYDVSGTSRRCFQTLQDERRLSVHFLLDTDGTLYQTLDVKERAWHAAEANERSIGVEVAQIGAYPDAQAEPLLRWYDHDATGPFISYGGLVDTGVRTPGFVARPIRPELQAGRIHGTMLYQYDFTAAQYAALARLLATLHVVLPRIRLDAPRDADGAVLTRALSTEELAGYSGVLGHYHVTERKVDPGPAFQWDWLLGAARDLCPGPRP